MSMYFLNFTGVKNDTMMTIYMYVKVQLIMKSVFLVVTIVTRVLDNSNTSNVNHLLHHEGQLCLNHEITECAFAKR